MDTNQILDYNVVEDFFSKEMFSMSQKEKESIQNKIFKVQLENQVKNSQFMLKFYKSFNFKIESFAKPKDIPPLPVQMFKKFDLRTCEEKDVTRILNSSATTTGIPSKIFVDKTTSFRQTKGLMAITKNFIGKERKPYLVLDEDVNKEKSSILSARGAAIRGFANFAKNTTYIMDNVNNRLILNFDRLQEFCKANSDKEVLAFGFTYIIWTNLIEEAKKFNTKVKLPNLKLLHGGGWKKLKDKAISKEKFRNEVAEFFGTHPNNIIDYYGMVEQLGVVFIDCEYGYKHVPDFAEVVIRDFYSMDEVKTGEDGLLECMSLLPTSYPGQALLTEDIGKIVGIDDCRCGRKGKYFVFVSRAEKAEIRGCGDTFAEKLKSSKSNPNIESNPLSKDEWDY
jgi:hypothetical protein